MSVDGVILTDLTRIHSLRPPVAVFSLVVGPDGCGKSSILRSIFSAAPDYNIQVLHSPQECFDTCCSTSPDSLSTNVTLSISSPVAVTPSLAPCLSIFHANFYDLQQLCEALARRMNAGSSFSLQDLAGNENQRYSRSSSSSSYLREGLILLMDDLQSLWELATWHGMAPSFLQFLQSLRATPRSAFVSTAVSEKSVPSSILSLVPFVSYRVPFPMSVPSSRLYLRPFMVHSVAGIQELVEGNNTENRERPTSPGMGPSVRHRITNTLCRLLPKCIQPTTTKRSLLMGFSVGYLRAMNGIGQRVEDIFRRCQAGEHACVCLTCSGELQETKRALQESLRWVETGNPNFVKPLGEEREYSNSSKDVVHTSSEDAKRVSSHMISSEAVNPPQSGFPSPSSFSDRRLYGLEDILDRLVMIIKIFLSQQQNESTSLSPSFTGSSKLQCSKGGTLLSSMPSTTGVLLYGPSGCGKSALTHVLRQRFPQVSFFSIRCSSLFAKYLGESERRLRNVYAKARAASPAIVVLDEIDVIALSRGAMQNGESNEGGQVGAGANVSKRMLAALLCELDGLTSNKGVLTIGTTNAPHVMDPAILRQGRLETLLLVPPLAVSAAEKMAANVFRHFEKGNASETKSNSVVEVIHKQALVARIALATEGCTPACLEYVLRQVVERCVLPSLPFEQLESGTPISVPLPTPAEIDSILADATKSGILRPAEQYPSLLTS